MAEFRNPEFQQTRIQHNPSRTPDITRNHFWLHIVIHTPVLNTIHMTFTPGNKFRHLLFPWQKNADPQTLRTQPVASDWRRGARSDATDHGNHMKDPCSQGSTKMIQGRKISIELVWPLVGSNGHVPLPQLAFRYFWHVLTCHFI